MFRFMVKDDNCLQHCDNGCSEPGVGMGVRQHVSGSFCSLNNFAIHRAGGGGR